MRKLKVLSSVILLVWLMVATFFVFKAMYDDTRSCAEEGGLLGFLFCDTSNSPAMSMTKKWIEALQWPRYLIAGAGKGGEKLKSSDPVSKAICFEMAKTAGTIMAARQAGLRKDELHGIFEESSSMLAIIDEAFKVPVAISTDEKSRQTHRFTENFYNQCLTW